MQRAHNLAELPDLMREYFARYFTSLDRKVLLRAVLQKGQSGWHLVSCIARPLLAADAVRVTLRYPETVLFEDRLDSQRFDILLDNVQAGTIAFGDIVVKRRTAADWGLHQIPLANDFMPKAGLVVSASFDTGPFNYPATPLLAVGLPYYPDLGEAIRAWSELTRHNGDMDARNKQMTFLLPELRAYFVDALSQDNRLHLRISGTDLGQPLFVKGAYWLNGQMCHFEGQVVGGTVILAVPEDIQRLEYVLTDPAGTIYDFQREGDGQHSGLQRRRTPMGDQVLVERARQACLAGEGYQVEFKPFVELGRSAGDNKLREVAKTVVAFANAQGGDIFIGIDDACQPSSLVPSLERWGACAAADAAERYRGALLNALVGEIEGAVTMAAATVTVDTALLLVVTVHAGRNFVNLRGDARLYIRTGSSNRQIPPAQWPPPGHNFPGGDNVRDHR